MFCRTSRWILFERVFLAWMPVCLENRNSGRHVQSKQTIDRLPERVWSKVTHGEQPFRVGMVQIQSF